MRWWPFLAEVAEHARINFVAPSVRAQECPRQCPAHSSGVVLEVEAPQVVDIDSQGRIAIPSASNDYPHLIGRQLSVHTGPGATCYPLIQ